MMLHGSKMTKPEYGNILQKNRCVFCKSVARRSKERGLNFKWQGMRESNSQQWFWRPLLYHLTNPLIFVDEINFIIKKIFNQ